MTRLQIRSCSAVLAAAALVGGSSHVQAQEKARAVAPAQARDEKPAPQLAPAVAVAPGSEAPATLLPQTYGDPAYLFLDAAGMQLREAEEARRDYLIGEVSAMLAAALARSAAPCEPAQQSTPAPTPKP
jgi:hypothetical protein